MKKRRKTSKCLNCSQTLQEKHNYCPNCGQENTNNEVSIGLLLRELTSNFFSLDSRFAHTIKPFLFSPGKITEAFISGKRVFYANPIRWYLVISIFHFFFFSKMFEPTVEDRKHRIINDSADTLTVVEFDSLYHLPDSLHDDSWPVTQQQMALINTLNSTTSMTAAEVSDSLKFERYPWVRRLALKQVARFDQENRATIIRYFERQIPIIIFFVLPIYAFILKLFFWRRGLYIKHLIHSIHIHSFFFFILGWIWILSIMIKDFEDWGILITGILTTIYIVFSFKKVYKIKKRWALFRLSFIGFCYFIVLVFAIVIGGLISFALL
ncbi:MAG: DUF3667 domain-containing protein [Ekhidna sp.]